MGDKTRILFELEETNVSSSLLLVVTKWFLHNRSSKLKQNLPSKQEKEVVVGKLFDTFDDGSERGPDLQRILRAL